MVRSSAEVTAAPHEASAGLHATLLDDLGAAICSGRLQPGGVLTVDQLASERDVSRPVVREVLRVLASMGLVEARRKIGTVVCPPGEWNVFDPQVIRWRLASADRIAQLRSLTELRAAVEPMATALAAERAGHREAGELVGLAAQLWAAGEVGDRDEFLRLDIRFHQRILQLSGNEMFGMLQDLVAEVLRGRHAHELTTRFPGEEVLRHHADVAQGIQRRDGERAKQAMARIMDLAWRESSALSQRAEAAGGA